MDVIRPRAAGVHPRSVVMPRLLAAAVVALLLPAADAAGQPAYAATPDTLRFHEVTTGEITIETPQGAMPMRSSHDATVAIVRTRGDTARAWFEALDIGLETPMGEQRPATDAVLRAPFTLRFDDRGRIETLASPELPPELEGISDLSLQFLDFVVRLPARPLRVGLAWSDTLARTNRTATRVTRWRSVARYRVARDTMVDGAPAVIVTMTQDIRTSGEGQMPGQGGQAATELAGTEEGWFVFAPAAGRLLARRRDGRVSGDLTMSAAGGSMKLKQSFTYRSALDAVR